MKGSNKLHHRPYIPLNRMDEADKPFICRLAPFADGFELEYLAKGAENQVLYRKRGESEWVSVKAEGGCMRIEHLEQNTDYECKVAENDAAESKIRLVRTGAVPEGAVVINYLHPDDSAYSFSGRYLCSPSLARLEDGTIVAGMDLFGTAMGQNLTLLFRSTDNGKTWRYLTDLYPFYWGSLFCHRGRLYILGLSTEYGNLQIAASDDGGKQWSAPVTIFYGSSKLCDNGGMHRAPMQMVPFEGRLYTTCEYGSWDMGSHLPAVLSIDENADLLVPENWTCTGFLPFEGKWREEAQTQGDTMEGNIILAPDKTMYNYLRWDTGKALKLKVDAEHPDAPLEFHSIATMPVTNSMFRLFSQDGIYYLISNIKEDGQKCDCWSCRNVLAVFRSEDLENWERVRNIVNRKDDDPQLVGFQYPAYLFDENGLSVSVRSAFNNAHSFHDSNYILYFNLGAI